MLNWSVRINPLLFSSFLDGEMKNVMKERKVIVLFCNEGFCY